MGTPVADPTRQSSIVKTLSQHLNIQSINDGEIVIAVAFGQPVGLTPKRSPEMSHWPAIRATIAGQVVLPECARSRPPAPPSRQVERPKQRSQNSAFAVRINVNGSVCHARGSQNEPAAAATGEYANFHHQPPSQSAALHPAYSRVMAAKAEPVFARMLLILSLLSKISGKVEQTVKIVI